MQHPGAKPGTSIALGGIPGCGKTVVGDYMDEILGPHSMSASNPKYVTGQFNAHLCSLVLLRPEEAFWAGNREAESTLKDLITNPKVTIEAKYANPIVVANHVRLFATSNERWVVPAGLGDRRWAVFDVLPDRASDMEYWRPIQKIKHGDGPSNLLHYLRSYEYDRGILRRPPKTLAKLDQIEQSLKPLDAWWLEVLINREMVAFETAGGNQAAAPLFGQEVERACVYGAYELWHRRHRRRSLLDDTSLFWKRLRTLTSDKLEERRSRAHGRKAAVAFPALDDCRQRFASMLGYSIEDLFGAGAGATAADENLPS